MKKGTLVKVIAAVAVMASLVGCSNNYSDNGANWGSYKCTAMAGRHASIGWAAGQSRARDIAMDKCRAHANNPNACHVTQCVNE